MTAVHRGRAGGRLVAVCGWACVVRLCYFAPGSARWDVWVRFDKGEAPRPADSSAVAVSTMVQPLPQRLNPTEVARRVAKSQKEREIKSAMIDEELSKVVARMQKAKQWSRLDEVKEEEAAAAAAEAAEAERKHVAETAQAQQRALYEREQAAAAAKAPAKPKAPVQCAPVAEESAVGEGSPEQEAARWAAADHALAERLSALVTKVESGDTEGLDHLPDEAIGLLGSIFEFPSKKTSPARRASPPRAAVSPSRSAISPVRRKDTDADMATGDNSPAAGQQTELELLEARHKALEAQISELRTTNDATLTDAITELRDLKPRLRQLRVEARRADRLADIARGKQTGVPVIGTASLVSARRLERQRARMEARGGGMVF